MSEQKSGKGGHSNAASVIRLLGESMAVRALRKAIAKFAPVNASVLVTGETGSGKELVARSLHAESGRSNGPFVAVNCAALPESLFQAEVFGYEKGAFTGAYRRHAGRVEAATGGTLFLDEIGDLGLGMQVVLLRFLEEGVFEHLGSVKPIHSDVRIIAATSSDLEKECRRGHFREDLYYRLNTLRIRTPPLRERGDDIWLLAEHFLEELSAELGLRRHKLSDEALAAMRCYSWPGNVRELRNRIRQALVMSEGDRLGTGDLELEPGNDECSALTPTLRESREAAEKQAIEVALAAVRGDIPVAAERLCVSRAQLYRLISRYKLNPSAAGRRRSDKARLEQCDLTEPESPKPGKSATRS